MLSSSPFTCPAELLRPVEIEPPPRAAVVWAASAATINTAYEASSRGIVRPVMVGDVERIRHVAAQLDWQIAAEDLVGADDEDRAAEIAVGLARSGSVQVLVKGDVHTDALMRAVVNRQSGIRTGRRMSHVFHLSAADSDRHLIVTDAALNVAPDVPTRIEILKNAVTFAKALGNENPRAAILSATEVVTTSIPSSVEAAEIVQAFKQGAGRADLIQGPMALDLAVSPAAAVQKNFSGPVAGAADIIVVPNIDTGNALYKSLVYFRGMTAAGLVMGAKIPLALTSRADPPAARLASIALAARTWAGTISYPQSTGMSEK